MSHDVIRVVHEYNEQKGEVVAAYTFDAGPNAVIYTTEAQVIPTPSHLLGHISPISSPFFRRSLRFGCKIQETGTKTPS